MKLLPMLRRLKAAAQILQRHPSVLLRIPSFLVRTFVEGPEVTLRRLRDLSDPSRLTHDYNRWLRQQHDPSATEQSAMRLWANSLETPPLISVVMPVFNPNPVWLLEAIQSVKDQWYPHWQLCIADDCSTNPVVRQVLEQSCLDDDRVSVVFRSVNGHISSSSNSALELVKGEWVALLDHDDVLSPDALTWIARSIIDKPETQMIYTDEDKIDEYGVRFAPYFKPDWNPGLIEGQNFFSHLGVYRAGLLRSIGGFRVGLEGSQDYDLLLRALHEVRWQGVVHVPRVLYHWRVHRESTASGNQAKPYVTAAAERALSDHLVRNGQHGKVESLTQGYSIRRDYLDNSIDLDVLFDGRNCSLKTINSCLQPLLDHRCKSLRIFISITSKQQAWFKFSLHKVASLHQIVWLTMDEHVSSAESLQALFKCGTAPWILIWDHHLKLTADCANWLSEMLAQTAASGVVAVAPKLIDRRGLIQSAGWFLAEKNLVAASHFGFLSKGFGYFGRGALIQDFSILSPSALLLSREAISRAGGLLLESRLAPHWWVDLCLRLRTSSGRLIFTPFAVLRLSKKLSRSGFPWTGTADQINLSEIGLRKKWHSWIKADPSFSPNLQVDPVGFLPADQSRSPRWFDM